MKLDEITKLTGSWLYDRRSLRISLDAIW